MSMNESENFNIWHLYTNNKWRISLIADYLNLSVATVRRYLTNPIAEVEYLNLCQRDYWIYDEKYYGT